jgi:hypothetical protein
MRALTGMKANDARYAYLHVKKTFFGYMTENQDVIAGVACLKKADIMSVPPF